MFSYNILSRDGEKGLKQASDIQCNAILHPYFILMCVTHSSQYDQVKASIQEYLNSCTIFTMTVIRQLILKQWLHQLQMYTCCYQVTHESEELTWASGHLVHVHNRTAGRSFTDTIESSHSEVVYTIYLQNSNQVQLHFQNGQFIYHPQCITDSVMRERRKKI